MRRISIGSIEPGMQVAKAVHDDIGRVLVAADAVLTVRMGELLEERGITTLIIEDEESAGIEIFDVVTDRTRNVALNDVAWLNDVVKKTGSGKSGAKDDKEDDSAAAAGNMYRGVENIIDEILGTELLEGMSLVNGTIKSDVNISIDTAVVAVVIGQKLRLNRQLLNTIAAGSMLQDVGLSKIDMSLAKKSEEKMTEEELAEFKNHAQSGFKIVRSLFPNDPLIAQIPLQHHERQDGSGYPRGLRGTGTVLKTAAERTSGEHITVTGEVAQIARRFAELSTPGPWGNAKPPETAVAIMEEEAGALWNAEIVKRFLLTTAPFPVGTDVVFTVGKLKRFCGIVKEVKAHHRDRPVVRILRDPQGRQTKRTEIQLWKHPDIQIASRVN